MKRIAAIIFTLLFCMMCPVISFADDIYIVDDGEGDFFPDAQTTTTKPAETTTASGSSDSIFGDFSIDDYLGEFSGMLGEGVDSILSGLDGLGNFDFNIGGTETTTSQSLPVIDGGERPTQSQQSEQLTTTAPESTTAVQQASATTSNQENELPSVLVVNNSDDEDSELSGSTLTLLVFIAAIVILILVAAIVLVMMTRRTEYNSSVMDKSTIPSVEKPRAMSQFTNDDIGNDGNDYSNITYWNDNSGD